MFGLFRKIKCNHEYIIKKRSNALQLDNMGYPLRLCIFECEKCGHSTQEWVEVPEKALDELDIGESFLLKWKE